MGRDRGCLTGLPRSPKVEEFSFQEKEGEGEKRKRGGKEGKDHNNFTEEKLENHKVHSQVQGRCSNCGDGCAERKKKSFVKKKKKER